MHRIRQHMVTVTVTVTATGMVLVFRLAHHLRWTCSIATASVIVRETVVAVVGQKTLSYLNILMRGETEMSGIGDPGNQMTATEGEGRAMKTWTTAEVVDTEEELGTGAGALDLEHGKGETGKDTGDERGASSVQHGF